LLPPNGNGSGKHNEGDVVVDTAADAGMDVDDEDKSVSPYCYRRAGLAAGVQFMLGAWLWVCGQQIGLLLVTGLEYWIVFDVFGIELLLFWLDQPPAQNQMPARHIWRPYGWVYLLPWVVNAWMTCCLQQELMLPRLKPTFLLNISSSWGNTNRNTPVAMVWLFVQLVYLMYVSVYVCKETVEHILLSNGSEAGHHHHYGDKDKSVVGSVFVIYQLFIS
jgi:hypothetical protein